MHYCQHCLLPIEPRSLGGSLPWVLCQHCISDMVQPRCSHCGLRSSFEVEHCGQCLTQPPLWRKLYCVGDYTLPLSSYVQQLKFSQQLHQADLLARLLADRVALDVDAITYVPMHWRRQLWRGFNQSEWLARPLAKQLNIPCISMFQRTRATRTQLGMDRNDRQNNLRNAFRLKAASDYASIAIVDDVVTTGSTVQQLCKLLLADGVQNVDIYCVCRTPEPINRR